MEAEWLTHDDTLALQDVVRLDDLLLIPGQMPELSEAARVLAVDGRGGSRTQSYAPHMLDIVSRSHEYYRGEDGREPEWVKDISVSARVYMRAHHATAEATWNYTIPYTGLQVAITEDGLTEKVHRIFKLGRLQRIKQLGFLNQPIYNCYDPARQGLAQHDRWFHSLDVMAVGTMIAHNIALRTTKLRIPVTRTACLTHDGITSAGGDSLKLVDFAALDEDANYPGYVAGLDLSELESYGITKEALIRAIQHKGLEGQLLDIADKIAYTARDVHSCLHHIQAGAHQGRPGMGTIVQLLDRYPYVCGVWDCVDLQRGKLVFTSASRLAAFLKVRLMMFRELYYDPSARFGEFLMSRLFGKALYKRGVLTAERLTSMHDGQLLTVLNEEFGTGSVLDTCSSDLARCEIFETLEEGQAFMQRLREAGNVFAMLDDNRRAIKLATHFYVWTKAGPQTLAEAKPEVALELEQMARERPLVHVYYLDGDPKLSREVLARLKAELA